MYGHFYLFINLMIGVYKAKWWLGVVCSVLLISDERLVVVNLALTHSVLHCECFSVLLFAKSL